MGFFKKLFAREAVNSPEMTSDKPGKPMGTEEATNDELQPEDKTELYGGTTSSESGEQRTEDTM